MRPSLERNLDIYNTRSRRHECQSAHFLSIGETQPHVASLGGAMSCALRANNT